MDDADADALAAQLLQQLGVTASADEVLAWARGRTEAILEAGIDADLAGLLEGRPLLVAVTAEPTPRPSRVDTLVGVPTPVSVRSDSQLLTQPDDGPGSESERVPLPRTEPEKLPLPPVPQRPDFEVAAATSSDELEMLDEEDLELVEEVDSDGGEDDEDGEDDEAPAGAGMSGPEWKRALADAQGE